ESRRVLFRATGAGWDAPLAEVEEPAASGVLVDVIRRLVPDERDPGAVEDVTIVRDVDEDLVERTLRDPAVERRDHLRDELVVQPGREHLDLQLVRDHSATPSHTVAVVVVVTVLAPAFVS